MPADVLFLAQHALRIEVADTAALAARSRVDHRVDQGGFARVHGRFGGPLQLVGRFGLHAHATERLDELVVPRALDEDGRRRIRPAARVDVGSAVDAAIVEDDDADRQVVPANRLYLHAAEAEGAVAFDGEYGLAGFDGRGNR